MSHDQPTSFNVEETAKLIADLTDALLPIVKGTSAEGKAEAQKPRPESGPGSAPPELSGSDDDIPF